MEAIIFYLLKSVGVLAIFFFSYQLFLKKETFFKVNRHYLLAGILASLLLPLVIFTKHVYVEPVAQTFDPNLFLSNVPISYEAVESAEPFNWFRFFTYIYIIGVLVFGIRFLVQLTSLLRMFKSNTVISKDGFKLIEIDGNISPFSFFNYIVYNPQRYDAMDLEIIINHEKAHGNQLHSIDILVSQIFLILQWFNPLAWLYKKSIQQNLEFMADQFAISEAESAKQYQHTLLKASLKPQFASITNNFYNSLIKKRIIMLNQSKSNIKNAWKYFVILPALALFLMSFNVETVEVVKESEPTDFTSTSEFFFTVEDNLITNEDEPNSTSKLNTIPNKIVEPKASIFQKIIEAKITKNTTDAQLKEIKESLKKDGIEFNYKNIKRNAQNEITGIQVTYIDSDGNTGNYALSSESPINSFYFFKNENGSVGFKSENLHPEHRMKWVEARELDKEKRKELIEERKRFMKEHKAEMLEERERFLNERKGEMQERRKEIEIRIKEARKEHEKARKEHEEQRKFIIKERIKLHDSLKNRHGNIFIHENEDKLFFPGKHKALIIVDGEIVDDETIEILRPESIANVNVLKGEKALEVYGEKGKDGVVVIKTKKAKGPWEIKYGVDAIHFEEDLERDENYNFSFHVEEDDNKSNTRFFVKHLPKNSKTFVVKKNSSEDYLEEVKQFLKSEGITVKFSKLKRNEQGLITSIKISLSDKNGNKASASWRENDKGIPNILVGKVGGRLTASSSY